MPLDFSLNIVQGKGYDNEDRATGKVLWEAVTERLAMRVTAKYDPGPATLAAVKSARFGEPMIVRPRLGQGIFRVVVTDAYERRCAITGERTLPVLEARSHQALQLRAARMKPRMGSFCGSDLHTLFDQGYLTIDAHQLKVVVSSRIREEFENGREYHHLEGRALCACRTRRSSLPSREYLAFHNSIFR